MDEYEDKVWSRIGLIAIMTVHKLQWEASAP